METEKTSPSLSVYMCACVSSTEWKTMLPSVFMIPVYHRITPLPRPRIRKGKWSRVWLALPRLTVQTATHAQARSRRHLTEHSSPEQ